MIVRLIRIIRRLNRKAELNAFNEGCLRGFANGEINTQDRVREAYRQGYNDGYYYKQLKVKL